MAINPFYIVVIVIGVVFAGITCLLGIYAKRRIIKYIPAGIAGVAASAFLIKGSYLSVDFAALGYAILGAISAMVFVVSLITALAMEFLKRRK